MMLTAMILQEVVLAFVNSANHHTTVFILKMSLLSAVSILTRYCSCTLKLHCLEIFGMYMYNDDFSEQLYHTVYIQKVYCSVS